ncbi:MAG: ABC transporter permease [Bacilli bacterium]|nr:ABC transporter permease [Bacilli bacterium]
MVGIFQKTILKRAPREYKKNYFKFFILHVFLIVLLSLVSGYLTGTQAVDQSYYSMLTSQNAEDGEFSTFFKFGDENIKTIEDKFDLNIEDNSYYNVKFVNKNNENNYVNIYTNRNEINKISLVSGRMPNAVDEILLEDSYSDYNKYEIGQTISINDYQFNIVGRGYFADFPSIRKSSTDIAFKFEEFLLGYVNIESFSKFPVNDLTFSYAYKFNKQLSDEEKSAISVEMKSTINDLTKKDMNFVIKFLPANENRNISTPKNYASQYTPIILAFVYVMIAIIAFVFSIDTTSRIIEESKVIGTLRATGITRTQLTSFYLLLPLFVILISSIVGNLLGYFVFAPIFANIFTELFSFKLISIPFYWDVFILTTIVPSVILFAISLLIVALFIQKPTSAFLKGEIEHVSQQGTKVLKNKKRFFARLRERIFMKNFANYVFLFIGVILGSILFTTGVSLKTCVDNQINTVVNEAFCEDMYLLKLPVECNEPNVEKFGMYSFDYEQSGYKRTAISMYGIVDNSKYINIDFSNYEEDTIFISSGFQEKYNVGVNSELTFFDTSSRTNITYKVAGIYKYYSSPCLFAPIKVTSNLTYKNRIEPYEESIERILKFYGIEYDLKGIILNGYFSDHVLDCFKDEHIESIITPLTLKTDTQMMVKTYNTISIMVMAAGTIVYVLMMFLLTRHLMDKNTKNIALFKILGMTDKEILKSFNIPSFIVLVLSLIIAMPISRIFTNMYITKIAYKTMLQFIQYVFPLWIYPLCIGIGLASFIIVLLVSKAKIKKVSLIELYKSE